MDKIRNHIANCNLDIEGIKDLIDLYNEAGEIDPNRKITGIDIFRNFEYGYPLGWLKNVLTPESKVLDIGSSSTIWPVLLYKRFGCQLYATDIDMTHLTNQEYYLENIGAKEALGNKFIFEYQDATATTYEDNSFDVVCSVSAIEHIPGDGDVKAVIEAERVLKPGGKFVFTAPFQETFKESTTDHYHFGYEKRYSADCIENRFAEAKGLKREKLLFINGTHAQSDLISDFWYQHQMYNNLGQISMFVSLMMFEISKVPSHNTKGFIALYTKE